MEIKYNDIKGDIALEASAIVEIKSNGAHNPHL